jgi:signal transduction histidine kinase
VTQPDPFPAEHDEQLEKLRHDLKNPLTTIRARAQLLVRTVQRTPSLTDEERSKMLRGLAAIDAAVMAAVAIMDDPDGQLPEHTEQ